MRSNSYLGSLIYQFIEAALLLVEVRRTEVEGSRV